MLQAILFDVDGVLLDSGSANVAYYQALFREIGNILPDQQELASNNHLSVEAMLRRFYPDRPDHDIEQWIMQAKTIKAGHELLHPMSGVMEVLPVLAKTYKLGLVTNRLLEGVDRLWDIIPLQYLFSGVAAYEDTEKHKPDPEPVRYALDRLGISADEAVFIGDALTDMQAAQGAGVRFILYGNTLVLPNTPVLKDFLDLPDLLQSLT